MTDMFRLDGKVAVVTGGGRGIGVMMARGLLQAGATVYLSSRKKAELENGAGIGARTAKGRQIENADIGRAHMRHTGTIDEKIAPRA